MEAQGLEGNTIQQKCTLMSGLITTCIKSGMLAGQRNPFDDVDYAAGEANHIPTAQEADYRALKDLLPTLDPRFRIPILIQTYCGTRISEVRRCNRDDFDLKEGTMDIAKGTAKNKVVSRGQIVTGVSI